VPQFRSNVPRLLKKFMKTLIGKIVPQWNRNVARWDIEGEKRKRIFSADLFHILRVKFTININLVSDEKVCRKHGLEANIQTRVYREFLLATNTRLGLF